VLDVRVAVPVAYEAGGLALVPAEPEAGQARDRRARSGGHPQDSDGPREDPQRGGGALRMPRPAHQPPALRMARQSLNALRVLRTDLGRFDERLKRDLRAARQRQ
jgi:hypothetical protein